jgi:hypothetical protein
MKHQPSHSAVALQRRRHRFYAQLLVATVLVIATFGLPFGLRRLAFIGNFLLSAVLAIELGGALTRQRHRRPADHLYRLLGLVNILAQLLWLMAPGKLRLVGLPLLTAFTLFIAWSLERLIQCLAKERRVGGRVVAGALAGYLLLGISGGLVLSVIDTIQPGSFISSMSHHVLSLPSEMAEGAAAAPVTRAWDLNFLSLNYFAFVSLTTVGYGDIVPMRPAAQIVSIALSVAGPFYIAVVMGVLISRLTIQDDQEGDVDS